MKKFLLMIIGILLTVNVFALVVEQNVTVTVLPGAIDVYSPVDGKVYDNRMVPINLSMSSQVKYFKYNDNGDRPITLCRNCNEYGFLKLKRKPFDDGFHNLTIMAVFEAGTVYEYRNFSVDTKKPKITKTFPQRGFSTGLFEVEFQEANPVSLWLNYGNDETGWRNQKVNLEECEEKRTGEKCSVNINLKDYDLQEIKYWFNITDIAGNSAESKVTEINVDTTSPVITLYEPINGSTYGKRVPFDLIIINEKVKSLNYFDNYDNKTARLCSNCNAYNRTRSFKEGNHNVQITAIDYAGNSYEELVSFEVDY